MEIIVCFNVVTLEKFTIHSYSVLWECVKNYTPTWFEVFEEGDILFVRGFEENYLGLHVALLTSAIKYVETRVWEAENPSAPWGERPIPDVIREIVSILNPA